MIPKTNRDILRDMLCELHKSKEKLWTNKEDRNTYWAIYNTYKSGTKISDTILEETKKLRFKYL